MEICGLLFSKTFFSDFNLGNDQVHESTLPTPQFQEKWKSRVQLLFEYHSVLHVI